MTESADTQAELAVLGTAMVGGHQVHDALDMLQPRDFYDMRHGMVWEAIGELARGNGPIDPVTVARQLGQNLQRVGGPMFLVHCTSAEVAPSPAAMLRYAEQVLDAALRRRMVEASIKVRQIAETADDVTQAAEDAQQALAEAVSTARTAEGGTTLAAGMAGAIDWLETEQVGAQTPWVDVNDVTNGLLAGAMITVAARPGHGKSLVLKDTGVFTAKQGRPVHIATLEMSRNEYMARILAAEARVNLGNMLQRKMSEREWEAVAAASERVRDLPLYLDDRESQTMAQIRAAARQTQRRLGPLGLIGIDYAQLVKPEDRNMPREQQVAAISRNTKLMAKEFNCPVMLLAQLNRGNTQRTDHTPLVSDLRESGSLEQDSDQVWLLHRPDQYGTEDRLGEVDLIVGKNRNGPAPTTVPLSFQGHYARVVSMV